MFMGPLFQIQQHLLSLTHWISKLPRRFEIDRVRQYLVNSMGLVGKVNAAVYKTETIFTALAFGKFSQFFTWHVSFHSVDMSVIWRHNDYGDTRLYTKFILHQTSTKLAAPSLNICPSLEICIELTTRYYDHSKLQGGVTGYNRCCSNSAYVSTKAYLFKLWHICIPLYMIPLILFSPYKTI